MKIIEALKIIKANRKKVNDLTVKVRENSARLSNQTSPYGDVEAATAQVSSWMDTIRDVLRENERLTNRIHKTNVTTNVTITLGTKSVTKTIDEWLVRRNEGVSAHHQAFSCLTDRGLKETFVPQPDGTNLPITIQRHYDARHRDEMMALLGDEVSIIDSTLEVVNATTDLVD